MGLAYDQSMRTLTRIATWIDAVATAVSGVVLRVSAAVLAFILRRGKHRAWRRRAGDSRRRSDG